MWCMCMVVGNVGDSMEDDLIETLGGMLVVVSMLQKTHKKDDTSNV